MIESILAGFVVSFGTIAYLQIGGPVGALLYSITILSIIYYDLDLFVGKAGLLTIRKMDFVELLLVLLGNLIGASAIGALFFLIPNYGVPYMDVSNEIVERHFSYGIDGLFILSVFSGMVMYAGITAYKKTQNWIMLCLPIMMVCLCRWPFIVSEFFIYIGVRWYWSKWYYLIPVFLGNLIGSNLFPLLRSKSPRFKNEYQTHEPDIADKLRQTLHKSVFSDQNKDNPENK